MRTSREYLRWVALGILVSVVLAGCGGGGGSHSNSPPIAVVGAAQSVAKRSLVTLDGSASHDPDGNSITYSWTQTAGPSVVLSSATAVKPTFTAPGVSGSLSFSLTVNDGQLSSTTSATTTVTVINHAPVASAGSDVTVAANAPVALDGAGSSDADGDPLTYKWAQTAGLGVSLKSPSSANPAFVAPNGAAVLQFTLVVSDGETDSASSTVTVTVMAPSVAPTAMAGMSITAPKRSFVTLNGGGSDPQGKPLTYQWTQTAGTAVTLQNATSAAAEFAAPATVGNLQFSLTVNDGTLSSLPSSVTVHVQDYAPSILSMTFSSAAPRRNDPISVQVISSDPDQDSLTTSYVWTRNGVLVAAATGPNYPLGNQVKNDVIAVMVTVSDGTLSASSGASVTIADSPAVLSGVAPTSATYRQPVSFQVTASDADGDPTGPVELGYGPAGFTVSTAGLVTWTPSGPLFEHATDMAWQVRLHNAPQTTLSGVITVNDAARQYPLERTTAAIPLGNNAIDVEDFDGNGQHEILIGTGNSLYILAKNGATDYAQTWVYPYDPIADGGAISGQGAGFNAVTSGDADGDGHREIFFAQGPVIVKLDGVTRREVARYGNQGSTVTGTPPLGPYCMALKYGDIDNDGVGELVCLGTNGLYDAPTQIYVLDARTMTLKWQSGVLNGGTSMAIGNVEGGSGMQIVTSDGFVYDGTTHQNLWAYGAGFGNIIDVGDVNGDGVAKIVGVGNGTSVTVFSATLKSPLWQIATASVSGTSALKVANLDGIGPAEILLGDAQWGNVTVYRYDMGTQAADMVSQTNSLGDGVSAIGAGDVDGDGQMEMIWGSDYYSSGPDTLAIASWTSTPVVKWQGPDGAVLDGPFVGAKNGLIAAGENRFMFATPNTNSGYAGERVIALDPTTGLLTVSSEIDSNWSHDLAFDVGNVTGGGTDSMLLGTATLYNGYFTAYDFTSNSKTWTSGQVGDGVAVTHADLNHDSVDDMIGITSQGYVYAWDVLHQTVLWSSTQLAGGRDVAAVDLDGDGVPEIIALAQNRVVIYKYSSVTSGYLEAFSYAVTASNLLVADTDGDGVPEIFVLNAYNGGQGDGSITQLNSSLQVLHHFTVASAGSLDLEQSAFGRKNLVVSISNPSLIYSQASRIAVVDPTSGTIIWQSPFMSGSVPGHSVSFYDWNLDGELEMCFGTSTGMYITR